MDVLVALASERDKIALVVGDLGYSVFEPFADRFINAGVAEQTYHRPSCRNRLGGLSRRYLLNRQLSAAQSKYATTSTITNCPSRWWQLVVAWPTAPLVTPTMPYRTTP